MKPIYLAIALSSTGCGTSGHPIIDGPCLPVAPSETNARVTFNWDGSLVTVAFGGVQLGQHQAETVNLTNCGSVDLKIMRVKTQVWIHPDWEIGIYEDQTIPADEAPLVIPIQFAPTTPGDKNLKVVVTTDSSVVPTIEFDLTGTGVAQ